MKSRRHHSIETVRACTAVPTCPPNVADALPGDCGIIAVAALTGASYQGTARVLTEDGVYTDGSVDGRPGCGTKTLMAWARANLAPRSRVTWQYVGTSLAAYVMARPGWTGLVVILTDVDEGRHAVAVVNGRIVNVDDEMLDRDVTVALRV